MTCSDDQAYRFATTAQWQAGAHNMSSTEDGLVAPPSRCIELLDDPGVDRCSTVEALTAVDTCGRLNWMSPSTRRWYRRYDVGVSELGRLEGHETPIEMVLGRNVIWLQTEQCLERHDAHNLSPLGPVRVPEGDAAVAMAADGRDGVWLVTSDGKCLHLRRLDRWGRECDNPAVLWSELSSEVSLVATGDGTSVVVLLVDQTGKPVLIKVALGEVSESSRLPVNVDGLWPMGLASDASGGFVLLSRPVGDEHRGVSDCIVLDSFDEDSQLINRELLEVPSTLGTVLGVGHGPDPVVRGSKGLGLVTPCLRDAPATFTYITPTLTAPLNKNGWNRIELTAMIPEGTSVEVDWVSSDDSTLVGRVDEIFGTENSSPLSRLLELRARDAEVMSWSFGEGSSEVQNPARCSDELSSDTEPVLVPVQLDRAKGQYLWVRVTVVVPVGREVPSLWTLDVLYGNESYIDHLPAIYQEDPAGEAYLRQILAPFEVVFDQLDAAVAALPTRIDPQTAPDDWTDYLLSWLGFPRLGDLAPDVRRSLLGAAPELLAGRGTLAALTTALDIVTDGNVTVHDGGTEPAGWVLPTIGPDCELVEGGPVPATLGIDTVARAQQPAAFRSGVATLGQTPLAQVCTDPALVLAQAARRVTITVAVVGYGGVESDKHNALASVIDRLVAVFVPAHCRVDVTYTGVDPETRSAGLDVDLRLADDESGVALMNTTGPNTAGPNTAGVNTARLAWDGHWRLGGTTISGSWQLPKPDETAVVLNRPGPVDQQRYLS